MGVEESKWRFPEVLRYVIVGGSGVVIGWFVYNLIYLLNPVTYYQATSTWLIAYLFGVWQQHALHWKFTFDTSELHYFVSLKRSYWAYSAGLALTIPINFTLVEVMEMHHQLAWLFSVGSSIIVNFTFLKRFAFSS